MHIARVRPASRWQEARMPSTMSRKWHLAYNAELCRWKTQRAVASGRLVKAPCEVCGASKVEAHHDDYSQPLAVRWLCHTHHREYHATVAA